MRDLVGKRLALMGTENGAKEVAQYCKQEGITLVSFGNRPEAVIHQVSDEQCIVDCTDPTVMIPLLREKNIDGVFVCTSEKVIRACSTFLSDSGYYFYTTSEQWDILMNKKNFKEYAKRFGISTAPIYELNERGEISQDEKVSFPVIVKPADSSGSVGISICNNAEEVKLAVEIAKSKSQSKAVLCEKYLSDDGQWFQFEIWLKDGKAYFPYVKQRIFYDPIGKSPKQPFIDIAPSSCEKIISEHYYVQMMALFNHIGVKNGHCWFQGIIDNGIPYIFDTGFRLGGNKDYLVTQKEKSINLIECFARFGLTGQFGTNMDEIEKPFEHIYAVLSIGMKNGIIDKIFGIDEIKDKEYVYDFHQYYYEGQEMTRSGVYAQTIFRVYVKADNLSMLKHNVSEVLRFIKVQDKSGSSLLLNYPYAFNKWIEN